MDRRTVDLRKRNDQRVVRTLWRSHRVAREHVALALAQHAPLPCLPGVFVAQGAAEVLLELLADSGSAPALRTAAAGGLVRVYEAVAATAAATGIISNLGTPDASSPRGTSLANSPEPADVVFVVEGGRRVHAHRATLSARSEAFRVMLAGEFREAYSSEVEVPDIHHDVFASVLHYCHTGELLLHVAPDDGGRHDPGVAMQLLVVRRPPACPQVRTPARMREE
jgi:hypothetical protein